MTVRNTLYYGDNLDVMRRHMKDETVDLVYLDPPFNSNQDYNVLFKGKDGTDAAAQIKAFGDTWTWNRDTRLQYEALVEQGGKVADLMTAYLDFLGTSDMMAYLTMMAPRLVELRRVMKPTASIYLHCDPTASHYLKLLMDAVFGPENFQNELVWQRTSARSDSHRWNHIHDTILYFTKSSTFTWHTQFMPYEEGYTEKFYRNVDEATGRRFALDNLTASGTRDGSSGQPWRGIDVRTKGNHWKYRIETLEEMDRDGRIVWPKKDGGVPRYKRFLDEMPGLAIQSIITDIPPLSAQSQEKLGYPTQKPEALLERIIKASSNEGDVVLDPFCGCGTAIAVAQRCNRQWLGIDITHLAISLMKHRLSGFPGIEYDVVGEPTALQEAKVLASEDPYQFQWWSLGLVGARPVEEKKGADKGIDGRKTFFEHGKSGSKRHEVIFNVKAGQSIPANTVRDLRGTMEREGADFGVLISLVPATKNMLADADAAGFVKIGGYEGERKYPRIQCITVGELLDGKELALPAFASGGGDRTLKAAPQRKTEPAKKAPKQKSLLG